MEQEFRTSEEVSEAIRGSQIRSLERGDEGYHITLEDGRCIVFLGAVVVALVDLGTRVLN